MRQLTLMGSHGHSINGILHVGANDGIEHRKYLESGASPCIYIEPIDEVFARLQTNLRGAAGHIAIQALCSDESGASIDFNIASNDGQSSSIFGIGRHGGLFPEINYINVKRMKTITVDDLLESIGITIIPNLIVIDAQGSELKILQGASKCLGRVDGVFLEVSETPLYEGSCVHRDITSYLDRFGLRLRWMELNSDGFGDAFYCRAKRDFVELPQYSGNLAKGKFATQSSRSNWSTPDDAQGAVNGCKTGSYGFHTSEEVSPWWQVDLGTPSALREIRIFNRLDAGRARARTLQVLLSTDAVSWTMAHDQQNSSFGGNDGHPLRVILDSVCARYVRLQLVEHTFLHLDEVEIY